MSIGIDQRFEQLRRQSEEDLYRESKIAPILIREERRDEILRRIPREKLQRIAYECLFFLGAFVVGVCLGYLLYLLLVKRIQERNTGVLVTGVNADFIPDNIVQVTDQFLDGWLLFGVFSLCCIVGIYLVRLVLWAAKMLSTNPLASDS
ncbi:MAG: hypothetical protein U0176_24070 [Bacteroidia bacterium]